MKTPRHHQPAGSSSTPTAATTTNTSSNKDGNAASVRGRLLSDRVPASPRAGASPRSQLSQRSRASASISNHSAARDQLLLDIVKEGLSRKNNKDVRMPPGLQPISAGSRPAKGASCAATSTGSPLAPQALHAHLVLPPPNGEQFGNLVEESEAIDDHKCSEKPGSAAQPAVIPINACSTAEDVAQARADHPSLSATRVDSGIPRIGGLPAASAEQQPQMAGKLQLRLPERRDPEPPTPWAARKASNLEPLTPSPLPQGRPPASPATPQWPITPAKALQVRPPTQPQCCGTLGLAAVIQMLTQCRPTAEELM